MVYVNKFFSINVFSIKSLLDNIQTKIRQASFKGEIISCLNGNLNSVNAKW